MDRPSQPSTFPWLFRVSAGAWQGTGISSLLQTLTIGLRGKWRQGQEVSTGVLALHPCSSLGAQHQALGEDLGAATTTQGPWGTVRTAKDPLIAEA